MGRRSRIFVFVAVCFAAALTAATAGETPCAPFDCVDPTIGTGGYGFGVGSAYPGATVPFGMVALSPDTTMGGLNPGFSHCAGYYHADPQVRGFSHTHLHGTGLPELGELLVMPASKRPTDHVIGAHFRERFEKRDQTAEPGYYAVRLADSGIVAELTAAQTVGVHRYTFPEGATPTVLFNPSHSIDGDWVDAAEIVLDPSAGELSGSLHANGPLSAAGGGLTLYFVARFDVPIERWGTWTQTRVTHGAARVRGADVGAFCSFDRAFPGGLELRVAISRISVDQARANLAAEGADFETTRARAREAWTKVLDRVAIDGATEAERRVFYTALYHAYLMPTDSTEAGGRYLGFDGQVHDAGARRYYTNFSLWDTFRTQHPLLFLLEPARSADMMQSLVAIAEQGGSLPMWPIGNRYSECMIGTPADIVLADAVVKGIDGFDADAAYRYARAHATGPVARAGRVGIESYVARGYVCEDEAPQGASRTAEYAYADAALARWAEKTGRAGDAAMFGTRSRNWANHFDPKTGFARGRKCDGSFVSPFVSTWVFSSQFVEGNAWQWTWYAPHDVPALIEKMGGREAFVARLSAFFERATRRPNTMFPDTYYWHGNEPDILTPYYFDFAGRPDLTQKWVRWAMRTKYDDTPHGLDGNDDAGTLSAWYVFSAMGLMPLAGTDQYLIGSPPFRRLTMKRPEGDLVVVAENASPENAYVQSVTLNGEPLAEPFLRHADLAGGAVLRFVMGCR